MTPSNKAKARIRRYEGIINLWKQKKSQSVTELAKQCALAERNEVGVYAESIYRNPARLIIANEFITEALTKHVPNI